MTLGLRALLAVLCMAIAGPSWSARSDEPNQAAVVVAYGEGRVESRCVTFVEESITGADLLARSGLDVVIDSSSGLGITVCKIEGLGCDFPARACFCECMGGQECRYWNYYYREPGDEKWTYSPLGALLHKASPGSVEAWVWGDGHTPPGMDLTYEALCPSSEPSQRSTALAQATASGTGAEPSPSVAPSPTVAAAATGPGAVPSLGAYWPFGLIVLILIALAAYLRLGRR